MTKSRLPTSPAPTGWNMVTSLSKLLSPGATGGGREEAGSSLSLASRRWDSVSCPEPIRSSRRHVGRGAETGKENSETEVLDVILGKGHAASSPPYFSGSPPGRAANPLVLDARFGGGNAAPPVPLPAGRDGYVRRPKDGASPAAVRVEGFDCRGRGGRRGSIPAVA